MAQSLLFQQVSISVTDLTRYLRRLLETDEILQDVWVIGEISNLSRPTSGHIYFTLKDASATLRCVIWKTAALRLRVNLQNGYAVEAHGAVSLYERDGQYQLYIDALRPAGEGYLFQEFLRLKSRLEAEGLFEEDRKRPIPTRPQRIGIVTSPTGAALQDMLNTLSRRYPLAEVIIAPAMVQGEEAPSSLVNAIKALNAFVHPDVILLARGGGSLEDLWAFNDEWVVRAVATSEAPIISGIGHETDFTLCDFAADLRAPTPTGAAILAAPDKSELLEELNQLYARLVGFTQAQIDEQRRSLENLSYNLALVSPQRQVDNDRQQIDVFTARAQLAIRHQLQLTGSHLHGTHNRLLALSPLAVLERGFAIISKHNGQLVRSIQQVQSGTDLHVRLFDGSFDTQAGAMHPEYPPEES